VRLEENGYKESKKNPNLFYRFVGAGFIYADMRGTEEVPIWEDPVPLIYFRFDGNIPLWKQVRIKEEQISKLKEVKCPYRFSFYEFKDETNILHKLERTDEHFASFYEFYDEVFPNGYCMKCGKDIQKNSYHCSDECKEQELKRMAACRINASRSSCEICKRKITPWAKEIKNVLGIDLPDKEIEHHTSYDPEVTIVVCNSCHAKIHLSEDPSYIQYRPMDERPKPKRKFHLVECSACTGNAKVEVSENEGICHQCKKKGRTSRDKERDREDALKEKQRKKIGDRIMNMYEWNRKWGRLRR